MRCAELQKKNAQIAKMMALEEEEESKRKEQEEERQRQEEEEKQRQEFEDELVEVETWSESDAGSCPPGCISSSSEAEFQLPSSGSETAGSSGSEVY